MPAPPTRPPSGNATVTGPEPFWQTWTFDSLGDILTRTDHAPAGNAGGDTTTTYHYGTTGPVHAVTSTSATNTVTGSLGSTSYGYNGAGQTTTLGAQTLTWTPNGSLATAGTASAPDSYAYDADGNELVENDNGTATLYLPGEQLTASGGTTTGVRYYSFANKIIGETTGGTSQTLYWLGGNTQGTMTTAVEAFSEGVVIRRAIEPYGTVLNGTGTWPDNRTFLGDPSHSSSGLVDVGARKYNPATGLFISVDPNIDLGDPQTLTGYTYAADNPVSASDPSGELFMTYGGGGGGGCPDGTRGCPGYRAPAPVRARLLTDGSGHLGEDPFAPYTAHRSAPSRPRPKPAAPVYNPITCARFGMDCSIQGEKELMANIKSSGFMPDFYTLSASICILICKGYSVTIDKFGRRYVTSSWGVGFGASLTLAPGFMPGWDPADHTRTRVQQFLLGKSVTDSFGVGPVSISQQNGFPEGPGPGQYDIEPGVGIGGDGFSHQWSYTVRW